MDTTQNNLTQTARPVLSSSLPIGRAANTNAVNGQDATAIATDGFSHWFPGRTENLRGCSTPAGGCTHPDPDRQKIFGSGDAIHRPGSVDTTWSLTHVLAMLGLLAGTILIWLVLGYLFGMAL